MISTFHMEITDRDVNVLSPIIIKVDDSTGLFRTVIQIEDADDSLSGAYVMTSDPNNGVTSMGRIFGDDIDSSETEDLNKDESVLVVGVLSSIGVLLGERIKEIALVLKGKSMKAQSDAGIEINAVIKDATASQEVPLLLHTHGKHISEIREIDGNKNYVMTSLKDPEGPLISVAFNILNASDDNVLRTYLIGIHESNKKIIKIALWNGVGPDDCADMTVLTIEELNQEDREAILHYCDKIRGIMAAENMGQNEATNH